MNDSSAFSGAMGFYDKTLSAADDVLRALIAALAAKSNEDQKKTEQYKANAQRAQAQRSFVDFDSFLETVNGKTMGKILTRFQCFPAGDNEFLIA